MHVYTQTHIYVQVYVHIENLSRNCLVCIQIDFKSVEEVRVPRHTNVRHRTRFSFKAKGHALVLCPYLSFERWKNQTGHQLSGDFQRSPKMKHRV